MRQADIFLTGGEGDAWLERNRDKIGLHDPVSDAIESIGIRPQRVLEVGCANGWRLAKLREKYGCAVFGVEPSMLACIEAADLKVPVWQMTASTLPEFGPKFDLVIYGFCLYLTDPADWFNIVAEGDRALAPGGHMVIHDFIEPGPIPFAQKYEHRDSVFSYHFNFSKLWLAHPAYRMIKTVYGVDEEVTVLWKKRDKLFQVQP